MTTDLIQNLLRVADAYCEIKGISEARVSTLALNGGRRLKEIRDGRDIGVRTAQKALLWFSENWIEGAIWPQDIPRPRVLQEDADLNINNLNKESV